MSHEDFWVRYPWWHQLQGRWFDLECRLWPEFWAEMDEITRVVRDNTFDGMVFL